MTKETAKRYRRASKTERGRILDELCALTGWSRDHARKALRRAWRGHEPKPRGGRRRPPVYGEDVLEPLRRVWATLGGPCGKRLAPFMAHIVEAMERHGELVLAPEVRAKLLVMSPATIDRRLAPDRLRLGVGGRSGTKPGTLLKCQIPIRTFADWDDRRAGFFEADLVGHDGGSSRGEFCQTLDLTCVNTTWTELRAVPNKAQRWVFEAIDEIRTSLPFPMRGLDSDNGSEFINAELLRYCVANRITFTRSRAYRKNDNAHVEQKNWTAVRQNVGYARFDTPKELACLNELYGVLGLLVNFFTPTMKLIEKTRDGAKLTRRYDVAQTPYQRVLASPDVPAKTKAALTERFLELNPVELRRQLTGLQHRLLRINRMKHSPKRKEVKAPGASRASSVRQRSGRTRAS
ncbi:MAG: integrase [Actinomycetota bacterium]